jgi:hypothetical protein
MSAACLPDRLPLLFAPAPLFFWNGNTSGLIDYVQVTLARALTPHLAAPWLLPGCCRDYLAMCRDYYTLEFMARDIDTAPIAPALQV